MPEDALIPKMKRLNSNQRKVKIPVNNFILIVFCILLMIGATFVNVEIKHYIIPQGFSFNKYFSPEDFVYSFCIVPQIPALMLICSLLGKRLAITCTCLYVILGLFALPIFALGGGIGYVSEYSFGYILAFIIGVYITGSLLSKKYSFLNMVLGAVLGVLAIHFCGIIYMTILALFRQEGSTFIQTWICTQSGIKIIYDVVLSFIAILIGKHIRLFLEFLSD